VNQSRAFARAAISTPHYLASLAGAEVLADGGNAIDAIVAANLALGVVAPYYCGSGGDLLAIVWDGALHGYRSAGRAGAHVTVDAVRSQAGTAEMPVQGPHTVTVPGAVRGWFDLLERFGTRSFGELSRRAVELARDGFVLTRAGSYRLGGSLAIPRHLGVHDRDLAACYPQTGPGALVRQPALVRTLETLASDGPDAYYGGPIGAAIAETVQRHGGFLDAADVAAHTAEWVTPLEATFAGHRVVELPPPTQGVTALEMVRIADSVADLATLGDGVERTHLLIEIARLALADRDAHVADPDHMPLAATRLLDDEWIAARVAQLDRARARPMAPRRPGADGDTAYLCCADGDGMLVSLIQSNFTSIGSGLHVAAWGINLHNRGASFSLDPAHVNALAPRKLPLHTLIPALVRAPSGRPTHVLGTMGGHAQAQVHLQLLVRLLLDGDDPGAAIDAARWQVEPSSGLVSIEARVPEEWRAELVRRGHDLNVLRDYDDGAGHAHCIALAERGYLVAGDPRAESLAIGV
jgi:gamma-glutamyltranspeptidase/glutathione hydrolase